jgi:hypothetical protein
VLARSHMLTWFKLQNNLYTLRSGLGDRAAVNGEGRF